MVGEFPELQGLMGRYYAERAGRGRRRSPHAIEEHYKPQGPSDRVPTDPVSVAVALADKLDTLVGFWAIDEKPTGSKDPYALRRAALGVIRIVLSAVLRLNLRPIITAEISSLLRTKRQEATSRRFLKMVRAASAMQRYVKPRRKAKGDRVLEGDDLQDRIMKC